MVKSILTTYGNMFTPIHFLVLDCKSTPHFAVFQCLIRLLVFIFNFIIFKISILSNNIIFIFIFSLIPSPSMTWDAMAMTINNSQKLSFYFLLVEIVDDLFNDFGLMKIFFLKLKVKK